MGAVRCTHAATLSVVTFGALMIPKDAPFFTILALFVRAVASADGLRLLTDCTAAPKSSWTLGPTVFDDAIIALLAHWVAHVIGFLMALAALGDHVADISKSGLHPARLLSENHLLRDFSWVERAAVKRLLGNNSWVSHRVMSHWDSGWVSDWVRNDFLKVDWFFHDGHLVTKLLLDNGGVGHHGTT